MSDDWETAHGLDPLDGADAVGDADDDGINNYGEYLLHSDPNAAPVLDPNGNVIDVRPGIDTDGDGIPNLWEWQNGLNYLDPADAGMDFDRDGYTNLKEYQLGTDHRGAPSYKIVELGPFDGTSYVNGGKAILSNGTLAGTTSFWSGQNIVESVILPAAPNAATGGTGTGRPAAWSYDRNTQSGSFAYYTNHGPSASIWVAAAPSGAALAYSGTTPKTFHYWPGPSAGVVNLSGAATVSGGIGHDISSISLVSFSPSGNFAVGYRARASSPSISEWVRWDFTNAPVVLPLSGFTLSTASKLSVNDLGHVAGNATLSGKTVGVFWKYGATAAQTKSLVLPYLSGGNSTTVVGLSNAESPWVGGMANTKPQGTTLFNHAAVWKTDTTGTTPTAIARDLGTHAGGNSSLVSLITPQGALAGTGNVLVGSVLKQQVFFCKPAFDPDTGSISGALVPQGVPGYSCSITHLNHDGEILGRFRDVSSNPDMMTLWRHGKAYPVNPYLTEASGYILQSVDSLNAVGTMLATAWKGEYSRKVLLIPDRDADGDGFTDAFENAYGFNAFLTNNTSLDSDDDGLSDIQEMRNSTNPRNPDTDDDGMKDGWEVSWGLLPLVSSDATLEPDGDQVSNLREFQIGTNPTGIYKVDVLPLGSNKGFHSAADDGSVITQQIGAHEWSENNSFEYISAPDPSGARSLDTLQPAWCIGETGDDWWHQEAFWPSYHNTGDGTVNAIAWDYSESWDVTNGTSTNWNFTLSMADCTDPLGVWVDQTDIALGLAADGRLGEESDAWFRGGYPNYLVSPSGNIRVMQDPTGTNIEVDPYGEFIDYLPDGDWQLINNEGIAIGTRQRTISSPGAPSRNVTDVYVSDQNYPITLPAEWFPSPFQPFILSFSDDGLALLNRTYMDPYGMTRTMYWVLDTSTGICSPIRTPGLGIESATRTSDRNGRIVGNGPKPFQITPDGSCIRLEALRIRTSPGASPVPFGSLYTKTITANHVSSDGRITLTTLNASGQTIILQIVPDNDVDADGMTDDWEATIIEDLLDAGIITVRPTNPYGMPDLSPDDDHDLDGVGAAMEFQMGTSDADPDDVQETEIVKPFVWTHNRFSASSLKLGFMKEFVPSDPQTNQTPPVPPKYYMKQTTAVSSDATTTYSHHSRENGSTKTIDRDTHLISETWAPTIIVGNPLTWPDWWYPGAWVLDLNVYTRNVTKTKDTWWDLASYKRPPSPTSDNATGTQFDWSEINLLDEYTTDMLIEDGDKAFDAKLPVETAKPWIKWNAAIWNVTTYTERDEAKYERMQCEYAMEPPWILPDKPVRLAWLEIDRPNLSRGLMPEIADDPTAPVVTVHQEYYSKARLFQESRDPSTATAPIAEVRTLVPELNHEKHVIPLECSVDVQHFPGDIIASEDGAGQPIPVDWNAWGTGNLSWSYSHPTGGPANLVTEEFDVPVKLEAIKGGDKIRMARRDVDGNGNETFTPISLPIADLRSMPHDLVLQTIAPGDVVLRISATTKNGLKLSRRSQGVTILPVPEIFVYEYGQSRQIGDMVPSTKTTNPEKHFVTPKLTSEIPDPTVKLSATGIDYHMFEQFYKWDPQSAPDPADTGSDMERVLTHRVSRSVAHPSRPFPVMIREKSTDKVVAKVNVWVVWADYDTTASHSGKARLRQPLHEDAKVRTIGDALTSVTMFQGLTDSAEDRWKFVFTIKPSWMIDGLSLGQDVPNLSGKLPPNTLIPGGDGVHQVLGPYVGHGAGGQFKYGASHYWDVSRQMQITVQNPNLIPKNDFEANCYDLYSTQTKDSSTPVPFPSDPVMGNDDVGDPDHIAMDESNDPYSVGLGHLSHFTGQVASIDSPSAHISVAAGAENREYEELDEFREFVRLKLPSGWYRVSDYVNWRFDFKVKFAGGEWRNNGCDPSPTQQP